MTSTSGVDWPVKLNAIPGAGCGTLIFGRSPVYSLGDLQLGDVQFDLWVIPTLFSTLVTWTEISLGPPE